MWISSLWVTLITFHNVGGPHPVSWIFNKKPDLPWRSRNSASKLPLEWAATLPWVSGMPAHPADFRFTKSPYNYVNLFLKISPPPLTPTTTHTPFWSCSSENPDYSILLWARTHTKLTRHLTSICRRRNGGSCRLSYFLSSRSQRWIERGFESRWWALKGEDSWARLGASLCLCFPIPFLPWLPHRIHYFKNDPLSIFKNVFKQMWNQRTDCSVAHSRILAGQGLRAIISRWIVPWQLIRSILKLLSFLHGWMH